jgi:hypothetical protein
MDSIGTNLQNNPSPFRFDSTPQGEADVASNQIGVTDGIKQENDGWGADGFSFGDILDVLNPLQHIPVVSSIYRAVTGDEIAAAPRAIGSALFGGPVGLIAAISNQVVEAETGSDIAGTALAMLSGGDGLGSETAAPGQTDRAISTEPQQVTMVESVQNFPANAQQTYPGQIAAQQPLTAASLLQAPSQAGGLFTGKDRQVSPTTTRTPAPSIALSPSPRPAPPPVPMPAPRKPARGQAFRRILKTFINGCCARSGSTKPCRKAELIWKVDIHDTSSDGIRGPDGWAFDISRHGL